MNPFARLLLIVSATSAPLGAAVVIQDSFDGMMAGDGLNGRTPETSDLGGNWIAPADNYLSDGAGNVVGKYTQNQSAFIDLGSGYMAANPGVYTLTATVTVPSASNNSFVGFGFTNTLDVADDIAGTARPMMWQRQNGSVSVLAGGSARPADNVSSSIHGSPAGNEVTMMLVLDASNPSQYFARAFIDGYEFDLNGATAGTAYKYGATVAQRYIALTTFNNSAAANTEGPVRDFTLDFTAVPEPSTVLLSMAGICLGCVRRKR